MSTLENSDEKNILAKIMKFCAYRERTWKEVESKLQEYQASKAIQKKIIEFLNEENFVNEQRFAAGFVRGKTTIKKWGRKKIVYELKSKKIGNEHVDEALSQIDEENYKDTLQNLLETKNTKLKEEDTYQRKLKLARFALSKGYESNLVWELINNIFKKQ